MKFLTVVVVGILTLAVVTPALARNNRADVNIVSDRNSFQGVESLGFVNRNVLRNGGTTNNSIGVTQRGYKNRANANILSDRNSFQGVRSMGIVNLNTLRNGGKTNNNARVNQRGSRRRGIAIPIPR